MKEMDDQDVPPARRLVLWLGAQVHNRTGYLHNLNQPNRMSAGRLIAANYAPSEPSREIFEKVAALFARYHGGKSQPVYGSGDLGWAMRRIGSSSDRGPDDPGARRVADVIFSSVSIPWPHLQLVILRSRNDDRVPPNWEQLVNDLCFWNEDTRYRLARSFYTPNSTYKKGI